MGQKKTDIPVVINNGEIIRDSTESKFFEVYYVTYGMKKDGYIGYYTYSKSNKIEYNQQIRDKIISDGVKDTFAFFPILVLNGNINDKQCKRILSEISIIFTKGTIVN